MLAGVKKAHLIGIGGIGVSAVAKLLWHAGIKVSGSDAVASGITSELIKRGMEISIGPAAGQLPDEVDLVVRSSAVPDDDPELLAARERGVRNLTYFEFLGQYAAERRVVAVAGTHGKSTTTAMLGQILIEAGFDPTVIVGSKVPIFPDGNIRLGNSDLFVIESCEHEAHLLEFKPQAAIVTNIEADHLDFYRDLDHIKQTFRQFVSQLTPTGLLVVNFDDQTGAGELKASGRTVSFGFNSGADYSIKNLQVEIGRQKFELWRGEKSFGAFELSVPGRFNIANAVAAATLAIELGVSSEVIRSVLSSYQGIWRRFEIVGQRSGVTVISDYGHHPTAVAATLAAAREFYQDQQIILVFQPHQRHRTRKLFAKFVESFDQADAVILPEIYDVKGREQTADDDISSRQLVTAVLVRDQQRDRKRSIEYAADLADAFTILQSFLSPDSVVLIMGAGDVDQLARRLVSPSINFSI